MTAALLSAAKSVPSGANVRAPTDCNAGPSSETAAATGVRADATAKTRATPAMTAAPFNAFTFMHCLLAGVFYSRPGGKSGVLARTQTAPAAEPALRQCL